jgi:hypothetical protein
MPIRLETLIREQAHAPTRTHIAVSETVFDARSLFRFVFLGVLTVHEHEYFMSFESLRSLSCRFMRIAFRGLLGCLLIYTKKTEELLQRFVIAMYRVSVLCTVLEGP